MRKFTGLLVGLGLLAFAPAAMANCNATAVAPALQAGSQPCSMDLSGNMRVGGIAAGTSGSSAQPVQGITGGVPIKANLASAAGVGATQTVALVSTATTNALLIRNVATTLYGAICYNTTASPVFLKVYGQSSTPVPGTSTPVEVIGLNANTQISVPFPAVGVNFAAGLGIAITNLPALLDNTAITAGATFCNIFFN